VFCEAELAFLRHDCPAQVYRALISERMRLQKMSVVELASRLKATEKSLQRVKRGESLPSLKLLLGLKQPDAGHSLLAGIGFIDQLLKRLGLHRSVLRHEFLAIAAVFFRFHPPGLQAFTGRIPRTTESGVAEFHTLDFEHVAAFGDGLLLHPGFDGLWSEMPDALWRCHLYTLQFARVVDLAQAYYQFATKDSDAALEDVLRVAEHESAGCHYRWLDKLRSNKGDLPLPPANEP
jgi:transcriptional regulator with XRE-family HTH domain